MEANKECIIKVLELILKNTESVQKLAEQKDKISPENKRQYKTIKFPSELITNEIEYEDIIEKCQSEYETHINWLPTEMQDELGKKVLNYYQQKLYITCKLRHNTNFIAQARAQETDHSRVQHVAKNAINRENHDFEKKRKRTKLTKEQKSILEAVFHKKRSPNGAERRSIADKCGLTPIQIRIWFTNKRMRSK